MKGKHLWLTLPILLLALMWTLEWRADNPTPTKTDLELRALLSKPSELFLNHATYWGMGEANFRAFNVKSRQPFVDTLILDPKPSLTPPLYPSDVVSFQWAFAKPYSNGTSSVIVSLYRNEQLGTIRIYRSSEQKEYSLHPATVKRWTLLLLNSRNIGPQLRTRWKD